LRITSGVRVVVLEIFRPFALAGVSEREGAEEKVSPLRGRYFFRCL
jgi:hypothetical protein